MPQWLGFLLFAVAIAYVFGASAIRTCEDQKLDRIDNARAWTQAAETWESRANDRGNSHRERLLAAHTAAVYNETANQLRVRLWHCGRQSILGIDRIDDDALLEARGEL